MSENKNITKSLDNAIDVINAGGFEKGQMQAVVAKDSDWLIERLQGSAVTDVDLFNIWLDEQTAKLATSGFSADDIINSRAVALTMLKLPCGSRQMMDTDIEQKLLLIKHLPISPPDSNFDGDELERALCDLKHNAEFVPKIALAHLMKKHEIVMTSDALRKRIPSRVLLQKTPKGFVRMCVRGFTALRINGLLKRKCKKGTRKHYSKK